MAVDYDLVVIGSSWVGIYAARQAVQLQARVALVTQGDHKYLPNDVLLNHSLGEVGRLNYQLENSPSTAPSGKLPNVNVSLPEAINWAKETNSNVTANNSLAGLAALGVDVIPDSGKFCRLPDLAFKVANRKLRSRSFLLATGSNFVFKFPDGNTSDDYLTLRDLVTQDLADLPDKLIIVGGDPIALELAQTLARFQKQIFLVMRQPRILPQEDLDVTTLIQAQLEAEGIEIYPNSQPSQISVVNQQKWLQTYQGALAADEIILTDYRQPNIADLNLTEVDVEYNEQRIIVNQKLQTTNPQIYACGDLIGGYCLPNIAQYEVNLILKNTLFFPWYKTNYASLPWAILTQPNLARVGLTEQQAKLKYGQNIYVIKQYFSNITQAQILDQTTGFCKLLVREDGEILGCSLVGDRAGELITFMALMIQHQIRLNNNPMQGLTSLSISHTYPSMAEILHQASCNFYQQKLERHPKLLNRLITWFSIRKNWSK